ncbi:hypothetical protein ROJ8625_03044 [Roseivivax jejudonensis]|uniref:DUF1127 domain-containing protein n=1 Tax=Roseivivax jejudonensis TaxID=1529041 RepID=A0A1X6ZT41_9RHOB|nr:DUF1127 domain-containing protein [Roseivivax jejudonensis]SLN60047.1 hypothetical protein ROJ8625_03044 [Roseivivax jejudonensis]
MALADTNPAGIARRNETRGIFSRIMDGLVHIAETNHRVRRVQHLSALNDSELAARGLKREDIVRHVFRDVLYL